MTQGSYCVILLKNKSISVERVNVLEVRNVTDVVGVMYIQSCMSNFNIRPVKVTKLLLNNVIFVESSLDNFLQQAKLRKITFMFIYEPKEPETNDMFDKITCFYMYNGVMLCHELIVT